MTLDWWRSGVIYQIYPRSFMDSNNDGIGDLPGITSKLGYLADLGVDGIWISPCFPSPMQDFGYDVEDFTDIDPMFGSLDDFDTLVGEAHARGIKIILDLVPNHTSEQHPWFIEAKSSRDNPKRAWYIWRDAKPDGSPPNNWMCVSTGESSWHWDEATGQYYLNTFSDFQPDLNWENREVREAIYDVMRFWLGRGADGFRIDMLDFMIKDPQMQDEPPNPDYDPDKFMIPWHAVSHIHTTGQPGLATLMKEMREVFDEYEGSVGIGEVQYNMPTGAFAAFYGEDDTLLHLPFNFGLITTRWNAPAFRAYITAYDAALPPNAQPNYVFGNHDRARLASRIGSAQARVAAMLLLTLRGTPFIYYGEELGMQNVSIPPQYIQDPWEITQPGQGRDGERAPMQWDASPNAGFSSASPWLPVSDDYRTLNVEAQQSDPTSFLSLYKNLLRLRRSLPALTGGDFTPENNTPDTVFGYWRTAADQRLLVLLNYSGDIVSVGLPERGNILLSSHLDRSGSVEEGSIQLRGNEGMIIDVR